MCTLASCTSDSASQWVAGVNVSYVVVYPLDLLGELI